MRFNLFQITSINSYRHWSKIRVNTCRGASVLIPSWTSWEQLPICAIFTGKAASSLSQILVTPCRCSFPVEAKARTPRSESSQNAMSSPTQSSKSVLLKLDSSYSSSETFNGSTTHSINRSGSICRGPSAISCSNLTSIVWSKTRAPSL